MFVLSQGARIASVSHRDAVERQIDIAASAAAAATDETIRSGRN